ncbi:MAG: DUF1800 domain-containing protein [Actinomycetota bacterium]
MRGIADRSAEDASRFGRRAFIRTAALGAVAGGTGVLPALLASPPAAAAGTFVPTDPDLHLLRRATYGPTARSLRSIRRMGSSAWLDRQLDPAGIDDAFVEDVVASRYPNLTLGVAEAYRTIGGSWDLMFELGQAAILRAAWSERQLLEIMVDFWSNHLNVTNPSDNVWWSRHDYDRRVIRKFALGKFSQMLKASATHPAMMMYLNNAESTKDNPNENYGRELLELHTLGLAGGYDEEDMRQSTLVMTGFGISWDTGEFAYDKWNHYVGPVSLVGWSAPNGTANGGYDVGLDFVDHLAHHPSTAVRIATKLCERFVSDEPQPALVDRLAKAYLDHDTAIAPVLHLLFRSKAFAGAVGTKVRRPMEDVVATLRILGIQPDASGTNGLQGLSWMIEGLSHAPMAWKQPNGYPDVASAWTSAGGTLNSWNTHVSLAAHWWPDALQLPPLKDTVLPRPLPPTYGGLVDAVAHKLVFRKLAPAHRDAVLTFLGKTAGSALTRGDAAVTWRLPYLVAIILDSPYHGIR